MNSVPRRPRLSLFARLAAPLFACGPLMAQLPTFTVEFIGTGFPTAINDSGQIVGWRSEVGVPRAFTTTPSGVELLPLPAGMVSSEALDVNDAGVIVGSVGIGSIIDLGMHAVSWTPDGSGGWTVALLGQLPGHIYSRATAINNVGDIVGSSLIPGFSGGPSVLFTHPSGVFDLSSTGLTVTPDVNDQRVVVGGQLKLDLNTMTTVDLGVPSGSSPSYNFTRGMAINESGQVAGHAHATVGSDNYAVGFYDDATGWTVLSTIAPFNQAYGLNDSGWMTCEIAVGGGMRSALYIDGIGIDIFENLLAPGHTDWVPFTSFDNDVNSGGQVTLAATNNVTGQGGVVRLTPTGGCAPPSSYCTAKTTSLGTQPSLGANGSPSVAGGFFEITVSDAIPTQPGLFFHGQSGPATIPFFGGTLCVAPSHTRLGVKFLDATGAASIDIPLDLSMVGVTRWYQFWFRDPQHADGTGVGLSNGLEVTYCD